MNQALPQPADRKTVLVVDDDATAGAFVGHVLKGGGFDVRLVVDQRGAVAAASESHIDLLVSDIVLGGATDGLDVLDAVRAIQPAVPVLFMSGYGSPLYANTIRENHLQKPFSPALLLGSVERALVDA
jgi:DNA-binding NtrC family response regulator